jgi:hypothetical protein
MHAMLTSPALFRSLLGAADWDRLAAPVQRMHGDDTLLYAAGHAAVEGSEGLLARQLRRLLRLPDPGAEQPLALTIERKDGEETWTRHFGRGHMRSTLRSIDGLHLRERLGPMSLHFKLRRDADAIDWQLCGARLLGLPLPRWLCGEVLSRSGSHNGRYAFHIDVRLPLIGKLVAYRGCLDVVDGG